MDCYEAARMVGVKPSTIRQWARRGHIARVGTSDSGCALYDPSEILMRVARRPLKRVVMDQPVVFKWRARRRLHPTEVDGYADLHKHLLKILGYAERYRCGECGRQASDWAYDYTDSQEQVDPGDTRLYSLDPSRYRPLCRSCHVTLDRRARFQRAGLA